MTTRKTIALTRWTVVDKVMSLLFNMLSRLVITFLPRRKRLSISWLQSPSAVILEPPKIKSATVSPSICHEVMGPDAMILVFWMLSFKPTFSPSSFTLIRSDQIRSDQSLSRVQLLATPWIAARQASLSITNSWSSLRLTSIKSVKRLFSYSSLSAIRVVSSAYLRLLIFLPAILIPACASSSPAFLKMYSAYNLNK